MVRPYSEKDRKSVLELIKANIPKYFALEEYADFEAYLNSHLEEYFVFAEKGEILGAGGINYFPDEQGARISWDFVHPLHHGKGIGRQLLSHRIAHLKENASIKQVTVRTTQLVFPFYEKAGFTLVKTVKDFWAKGFDLYEMKMKLQ